MHERSKHWNKVYETKNPEKVSWFEAEPKVSLDLIRQSAVSKDGAIIDIGAGASRLAETLTDNGFRDVTALDLSETALATARRHLPQASAVKWIVADALHWKPDRNYDLWHDRAAFHFLTEQDDQKSYLETLEKALRTGGHVILGTFALDGPETCSGLAVQRYDAKTLVARLGPGYRLLCSRTWEHETPSNSKQRFHTALFRKL